MPAGRDELRRIDEAAVALLHRPRADENVHAVLLRELRMQRDAVAGELGDLLERRREVAVDRRPEAGRLLDRGILGKHEQLGARRRAVRDPARDLVLPRSKRGRLVDRILRGGDLERVALRHQSAFIQNCMGWIVSSSWSTSFQE